MKSVMKERGIGVTLALEGLPKLLLRLVLAQQNRLLLWLDVQY